MTISRCWIWVLAASAALAAVTSCGLPPPYGNARQAEVRQAAFKPQPLWFGGYLDVTLVPAHRLQDSPPDGKVTTVLSFIVSDAANPCEPSWGGFHDLEQADERLDLGGQVDRFRKAGNDVAVSFGGQAGTDPAVGCTDGDALVRAYAAVIAKYGLDIVDLDIEGAGLANPAAAKRRAAAIARLQAERLPADPLKVWLTLPVSADGLTPSAKTAIGTMLDAGVELAGVNIMTMNFGPLAPGQTMLEAAVSAAEGTQRTLAALYEKTGKPLGAAALWNKIGLTPMIGTNDVKGQVFTLDDAAGLNSFAQERGVGRISIWSLNRDTGCESQLRNGVSNSCSGVDQEPGMFAKLLGSGRS
jgi:chitinase